MNTNKIVNVVDPTAAQDAATKQYVDDTTGIQNEISQLDSSVIVTDVGVGLIQFTVDSVLVAQMQNNRMDFQQTDIFGVDSITFDNNSATSIFTQNNTTFDINFPTGGTTDVDILNVDFNSVTAFSIDTTKTQIKSITPITTTPNLSFFRDTTGAANLELGRIDFRGNDSQPTNDVFAAITSEIIDPLFSNQESRIRFYIQDNNLTSNIMTLSQGIISLQRQPTTAVEGAALVMSREDGSAEIGDEAAEINFNINAGTDTVYGNISVTWDNTTNGDDSSRMDFQLLTDDALQTVLTIRGSAITDNLIAMELPGESYIKAASGVMGYFTTSDPDITDSGIIGSAGSIQIPHFNITTVVTAALLNSTFGDFEGAIGIDENTLTDSRLWVKDGQGWWGFDPVSGPLT